MLFMPTYIAKSRTCLGAIPSRPSLLGQFGKNRRTAQKYYREFVREGIGNRPWDELKGQIYLGSEDFIERHSAKNQELKEIPRVPDPSFAISLAPACS